MQQLCAPLRPAPENNCKALKSAGRKCKSPKMGPQQRKLEKKTWDEEMTELFCEFRPERPSVIPNPVILNTEKQPRLFRLWDISQKFLFLVNNMLVASSQQSGSPDQLIAMVPNLSLDPTNQPIFMGLSDKTRALNCVWAGKDKPQLQLVEKNIMDLYKANEEFKSFTFYSKTNGNDETCSFESAAFPVPPGDIRPALEQPWHCKISDINHKILAVQNDQLIAAPQNSNSPAAVFDIYPNRSIKPHAYFIGFNGRVLSCVEAGGGRPQLKTEHGNIEELYNQVQEFKSFTFFRKSEGGKETDSLESAAFPGWFISTSPEPNQPVGLSRQGGTEITEFYMARM